jgi:Flp pilus assembly secretin CpaC
MDIGRIKVGGKFYGTGTGTKGEIENILQDSTSLSAPSATKIRSSLGGATTTTQAMEMGFDYGGPLDDLQVSFLIKATQIHQNSRQLTAPKAMVLSGESATLEVLKTSPPAIIFLPRIRLMIRTMNLVQAFDCRLRRQS